MARDLGDLISGNRPRLYARDAGPDSSSLPRLLRQSSYEIILPCHRGDGRVLFPAPIYGGGATINNWYWDVAAGGERMLFNAGSTETGASLVTVVVNWGPGVRAETDTR